MNIFVGIINYNGERTLAKVIDKLVKQKNVTLAIKVYDNCSTDRSVEIVRKYHPQVEVEVMDENLGPNPARNKALKDSFYDYTLIMDNDIYFDENSLAKLGNVLNDNENCMACGPLIAYNSNKDLIQYNGAKIHYIGATIINAGRISELQDHNHFKSIYLGAGALLIKNEVVEKIGYFDEDFFFGWEDGDFTFRITSAGYDCLAIPEVVAYHDAEKRDSSKLFYQIRNRWFFIINNYSFYTILLILPALFFYEVFLAAFLMWKKSFGIYVKANTSVIKNIAMLVKKHNVIKRSKIVSDRELLYSGEMYANDLIINNKFYTILKIIVNKLFNIYWNLVRIAIL